MDEKIVLRLEEKIDCLIKSHIALTDECRRLSAERDHLLDERNRVLGELDRILGKLEYLRQETF